MKLTFLLWALAGASAYMPPEKVRDAKIITNLLNWLWQSKFFQFKKLFLGLLKIISNTYTTVTNCLTLSLFYNSEGIVPQIRQLLNFPAYVLEFLE